MVTSIFFEASFNAAHFLPLVPEDHKCRRMHGHTYSVRIEVGGDVKPDGFVVDYDVIRRAWQQLHDKVDHRTLNDVPGLENPTSELIARWIAERLWTGVDWWVTSVTVRETHYAGATVRPERP